MNSIPKKIRVRIAPSPTGNLHIGTARTALFNYLFARKNKGSFILRIEDTDLERSEKRFEENIISGLQWLGINWDEGPDLPGNYGPYRQSERNDLYTAYIQKLLESGKAYYCFCSKEDLQAKKEYQMSIGQPPRYDEKCKKFSATEIKKNIDAKKSFIIRIKTPTKKIAFHDLIRGKVEFDANLIDDFAIAKSREDGQGFSPLYNFAVVIDDFTMEISHVIRGEDHISNTPKQIILQEALGLPQLEYAHLPLILGSDKSKMSKRHGSVSIDEYRQEGYLPEALINFMAFLGWNPGGEREIYAGTSLINEFSLEKVQKAGAIFNVQRLNFLNGFYIRQKPLLELTELCLPYLAGALEKHGEKYKIKETGEVVDLDWLSGVVGVYQDRLKKLSEITELTDFFFKKTLEHDKELIRWKEMKDEEIKETLNKILDILKNIEESDFSKETLQEILMPEAEAGGDRGKFLWPLRAVLTGKKASAGPFEVAGILGKEKTIERIEKALDFL